MGLPVTHSWGENAGLWNFLLMERRKVSFGFNKKMRERGKEEVEREGEKKEGKKGRREGEREKENSIPRGGRQ